MRTFAYDHDENLTGYSINGTTRAQDMRFNAMDRMTHGEFDFANGTRTLDYTYNVMNDRTSLTRDSVTETYGYDLNEQTTAGPDGTYAYDAAGNRSGTGFGVNNLNQYTAFSGYTFAYDARGNTTAIAAPTPTPAPVITTQPAPKTVTAGQTATFSVVASGAAPLSYQWRKNAANIANAIAASYTTPATTLADNRALFSVLVSNPGGSTLSNNATLTVNPAPTPTPTPTPPPNKVLPVTFNPNSLAHGTHPISSYRVYLQTTTPGAVIYWTHNRTTPVPGNGTTFKINSNYGPVDIPGGATWTLEAIAVKSGMTDSDVTTSGTYDNTDPGTSPPAAPGRAGAPQSAQFTITGTASYSYDAQNRLRSATVNGITETFLYDGLNRKFSQTISGTTTVNIWDGWNLIQEYNSGSSVANYSYVYGVGGILERLDNGGANPIFYFQDALGNTAYVTDASANMIERYKYDRFGNVTIYNSANQQLSASSYDIRHLYTGQLWLPQLGLYDLRNRVYSPTIQRFMQADPVGFGGDANHLYRYTGNNPLNWNDPTGTQNNPSGGPFWNGPQDAPYWQGVRATQAYPDARSIGSYNSLASGYNTYIIPTLNSPDTRGLVGSYQLISGGQRIAAAYVAAALDPTKVSPLILAAWGASGLASGMNNIDQALKGNGWDFGPMPLIDLSNADVSEGLNLYLTGGGAVYLYDSNWNWINQLNFYDAGNGTTYVYDQDWNWVGQHDSRGYTGSHEGGVAYSAGTGTYVGFGVVQVYGDPGTTGSRIPPQPVKHY